VIPRVEDVAEQLRSLFGGHSVIGIDAVVEAPASGTAAFTFENELLIEWEVMTSR
jgi:hypothetical protein